MNATITTTRERLYSTLRTAILFAYEDSDCPHLGGIYLEADPDDRVCGLTAVATDGASLAEVRPEAARAAGKGWGFLTIEQSKDLAKKIKPGRADAGLPVEITLSNDCVRIDGLVKVGYLRDPAGGDVGESTSTFPPWRQVIPEAAPREGKGSQSRSAYVGLNPLLVERAGRAAREFVTSPKNDFHARGFEWSQPKGSLDPVRLDLRVPSSGHLMVVLMPMRI